MRLPAGAGGAQLTYCTNIHAGESWQEVRDNLERHVLAVKARVSPRAPFGVGLRLSAQAAGELAAGHALGELQGFLARTGLYVFTINGFPHGTFHGQAVKERVYLPDWRDDERRRYSDELAELLAALLPEGMSGSVSTVPGAFAAELEGDAGAVDAMADQLLRHAAGLAQLEARTGKHVALALEPEPCCYLETIAQAVDFFGAHLHGESAVARLAGLTGTSADRAAALSRRHLGLCLDSCHAAVEFEDAAGALAALRAADIRVFKLQLSAGLRVPRVDAAAVAALQPYLDEVYLHQVVSRDARSGALTRYADLPDALAALETGTHDTHDTHDTHGTRGSEAGAAPEWRVHFHVPIFLEHLQHFESTQAFLVQLLALHMEQPISEHLEVETYTWDVLPAEARSGDLDEAIARELRFCLSRLGAHATDHSR